MTRRDRTESGFTLIELLVVIIILGILAAVVVFAVGGAGDKGRSAASAVDVRTLRTAEEARCGSKGQYGTSQELAGQFTSSESTLHKVEVLQGGPCGNTRYLITCSPANEACGPDGAFPDPNFSANPPLSGQWSDLIVAGKYVPPPVASNTDQGNHLLTRSATMLTDQRVLFIGETWDDSDPDLTRQFPTYIYDYRNPQAWTLVSTLDGRAAGSGQSRGPVGEPIALPNGKAIVHMRDGYAIFDGSTWTERAPNFPQAKLNNSGDPRFGRYTGVSMVTLAGPLCGTYCGKVLIAGQISQEGDLGASGCNANEECPDGNDIRPLAELYDPASNRFDAIDCPYDSFAAVSNYPDDMARIGPIPVMAQLDDGRVMMFGNGPYGANAVEFFDASKLHINNQNPLDCSSGPTPWTDPVSSPDSPPDIQFDQDGNVISGYIYSGLTSNVVNLSDGSHRILVGGLFGSDTPAIYDPNGSGATRWTEVGGPSPGVPGPSLCNCQFLGQLPGGAVVMSNFTTDTYVLDPVTNAWKVTTGPLQRAASAGSGVEINGRVLTLGNQSAEIYTP